MKNEAKSRQIALLLLLIIPGGKYLTLPSIFAEQAGRDGWIAVGILLLFDLICLTFLLWAVKLNKQESSFYEVLCKTIGKIGAKLVLFLFFLFFTARIILLSTSAYDFFTLTFSIKMSWPLFVLFSSVLTLFLTSRGFKTIVRLNELVMALILVGLVLILFTPATQIETDNLLPMFEDGVSPVLKTVLTGNIWFADYAFIYFVMDKVKGKQAMFSANLICFAIGAALTVFMNVLFVSLYGELAKETHLAISRVSQYALSSSLKGRLDWLSMSLWSMTLFLKLAVFTFSSYRCLEHIFDLKSGGFKLWVGLLVVAVNVAPLFVSIEEIQNFVTSYFSLPFVIVEYLVPLLMPLLVFLAEKKIFKDGNQLLRKKGILGEAK